MTCANVDLTCDFITHLKTSCYDYEYDLDDFPSPRFDSGTGKFLIRLRTGFVGRSLYALAEPGYHYIVVGSVVQNL